MSMEISSLEAEAKAKAAKHVANMLHAPDKLEKIGQMKFNVERKKASVEAMLKTAMQSQLDGVKTGLTQLEKALKDIQEVQTCLSEIETSMKSVPALVDQLSDVREETLKHSQLATARENLKHIFMVPETVRQTEAQITEGRLLEAHKSLVELENSRDDLLFELHKLPRQSSVDDQNLLKEYFAPVTHLSAMMEKHLKFILRRTLNTVRKDPKVIVTALRILEREEKSDLECLQRQKSTGFLPAGRPKRWKEKGLAVLRTNVQERIEGNQLETRDDDKMWLVRHLELIRMITVEDLRIAKALCQPVFPPHYRILEHFILLYHEALSNRLLEIIDSGLEGQEYVTVLSWILQTYQGKELMSDPMLNIPKAQVRPLLDPSTITDLQQQYLQNMLKNYSEWMRNTLSGEVDDWRKEEDPELDNDGCFHTTAPIIVYQMIDENLQVAATISNELVNRVLNLSMGEVSKYGQLYRNSIIQYKNRYFKDRTVISRFTRYMIAIVNNCERFEELAQDLKERWWKPGYTHSQEDGTNTFEQLLKTFQDLRTESAVYLLDESFLDIDVHFSDLLSSKWQNTTDAIDTVCATLEDYFDDYSYLKPKNFDRVILLAQDRVARRYITSMLQNNVLRRKISFDTADDRRKAADKIKAEAMQIKRLFRRVAGDMADFDSPFDALALLAEVLKSDEEMLSLDLGTLVKRYPDVSHEQLVCLLLLRGDMPRNVAKETAAEFVDAESVAAVAVAAAAAAAPAEGTDRSGVHAKSILSQVQVTSSINPFAKKDVESLNPFAAKKEDGSGGAAAEGLRNLNPFSSSNKSTPAPKPQSEQSKKEDELNPFGAGF